MQLVVPIAVRNAVSAATRTFTANSMIFCFFIRFSFLFGGAVVPLRFFGGAGVRGTASSEAGGARLLCCGILCP